MALVEYSDSDNEDLSDQDDQLSLPKASSLSLPGSTQNDDYHESTDLHQGRVRSFQHKRGNWPSFVSMKHESNVDLSRLSVILLTVLSDCGFEFHVIDEPHLSLSRTFVLFHHWIESFIEAMKTTVSSKQRLQLQFDNFDFLVNDEKTRSFLTLNVCKEDESGLSDICRDVDKCLQQFKAETYYEDPKFHISLLWCLGDITSQMRENKLESLKERCFDAALDVNPSLLSSGFNEIILNIGNRIYSLPLL